MGAEQAVNLIHKKDLKSDKTGKIKKKKIEEYKEKFLNPKEAAKHGKVDIITEKKDTRKTLISCLEMLITKRERRPAKKHGSIPL
jgi:propionyl-CoA carboxylase beta chain